jgi:23S rRNA pseudouridine2605 synthase
MRRHRLQKSDKSGPTARDDVRNIGLARALSKLGYCSRREAGELVTAGRVRLNGVVLRNPEVPVRLGRDNIEVDGQEVRAAKKLYWMLNKPRGVLTTASDEKGRETVYDYMPQHRGWLAPVGRLDKASEGLLLLTNDSEWAARALDPAGHIDKTYHVQIAALPDEGLLNTLRRGVHEGGDFLRIRGVRELRRGERNSWLEIVLSEGKNRHIRRIFEALGIPVLRLVRVSIGTLHLKDLAKGAMRELSAAEKSLLDTQLHRKMARPDGIANQKK